MKLLKNLKIILVVLLIIAFMLRIWQIDKVPVSLFGDEVDLGYQAYSILKTGKDYYGNPWPIHFHSLAEFRTPLYLYSAVPSVAIWGITALGVRAPAIIFGILSIWALYLLVKELTGKESLALVTAAVLTFSPWHIQYSRAGFEATELLFFLLIGLYFFFKALPLDKKNITNGKWLWLSVVCLVLGPWIYSTAKLFIPILLLFLLVVWWKQIFAIPKKYLIWACIAGLIVGLPIAYSTFFGGGTARFDYIGIFTDPTTQPEIGTARLLDAQVRGEKGTGLQPTLADRFFENKFTFVGKTILEHYFQALSANFFFNQGDLNLRQSITGIGEFYKLDAIPMIAGIILFFVKFKNKKLKIFVIFWILAGILPAALTRDGGNHATRLILILPPFAFLISYGLVEGLGLIRKHYRLLLVTFYLLLSAISILMYLHNYYVHYPWESERWWHAGYQEAIQDVKNLQSNYKTVVISTANEPPWIFFAGFYPYPPASWQKNFPIGNDVLLPGFGKVSHIDKFYFGSPEIGGVYNFGKSINKDTLYLADAKEVNVNLIMEPDRTPKDLVLLKSIPYPSGEPAFYLFTGVK